MKRTGGCGDGDWVAVLVRTSYERVATTQLERYGYEPFLPLQGLRSARRPATRTPLFPGYLFCRYAIAKPQKIHRASGVIRILGDAGGPISVPEAEVEAIRRVLDAGVAAEPCQLFRVGQRVRVVAGPLAGLCGTLVTTRAGARVVVAVEILRRAVAAEVTLDQLEPLGARAVEAANA